MAVICADIEFNVATSATTAYTAVFTVPASATIVNWCNFLMTDAIYDLPEMLKDMLKYRIATYRKSLFQKRVRPKSVTKNARTFTTLKIPGKRNYHSKESRRR